MSVNPADLIGYAPTPLGDPHERDRSDEFWVEVLDHRDRVRGRLGGVAVGGNLEFNANRVVKGSGVLTLTQNDDYNPAWREGNQLLTSDVNWFSDRLRVWWRVNDGDPVPLITGVPTVPTPKARSGYWETEVEILDKLTIPDQDVLAYSFSLEEGTNVVDAVVDILTNTLGETSLSVTESDATLRKGIVWSAAENSWLRVINDLLDSINYFGLSCDGRGRYLIQPYITPETRPVRRTFSHGETAIHEPDWEREQDLYAIPNRYVVRTQGDGEEPGLKAVAENKHGPEPWSWENRGERWVTQTEDVEASTQATADAIAAQRLDSAAAKVANYEVRHALVPLLVNDAVMFDPSQDRAARATVQSMSYNLEPGPIVSARWREVTRV